MSWEIDNRIVIEQCVHTICRETLMYLQKSSWNIENNKTY